MGKINKTRFLNALKYAKDDISKEDIMRIGEERGVIFPKRISRDNVIDKIAEEHFDSLYEAFSEFLYVPVWEIADFYNMSTEKINKLSELGVIKEEPKEKQFYSKSNKEYFTANTYALEAYDYDVKALLEAYDEAYGNGYRIRLETNTEEEVAGLVKSFDKIFEVTTSIDTYPHRNQDGYYSYFTIKKLNENSELKKSAQRLEIDKLNEKIKKIKTEHKEEIEELKAKVVKELGIERFNTYELMGVKYDLDKYRKEIEELKDEIKELKMSRSKAGRKSKLSEQDQAVVKIMRLRGDSVRKIAEHYGVGVATIDRIINNKNVR